MSQIIAIVGPSGVGKTSLLHALSVDGRFARGLEEHASRPFQSLFDKDKHDALANQLDYLLYRARQEQQLRTQTKPALVDGGLDMDFHGFTRLFRAHGWLSQPEFELCEQLYLFARSVLPRPDLILSLHASPHVIKARLAGRQRINIASAQDMQLLESFLAEWLAGIPQSAVLHLDVSDEAPDYARITKQVLGRIFPA